MRLIDADAVDAIIDAETERTTTFVEHETQANIKFAIKNLPTVEPVRGEWFYNGFNNEWECSHCHSYIALSDDRNAHPNFCPECGADMRK